MEEFGGNVGSEPLLRPRRSRAKNAALWLLLCCGVGVTLFICGYVVGWAIHQNPNTPSPVQPIVPNGDPAYRFAAVAADATECSKIGVEYLSKWQGSAVDAAIASLLCVGLYNAHSMGIGGGFLMTYYNRSSGEMHTVNAREVAPSSATTDMYYNLSTSASRVGGLAIAVPGELRGFWDAHQRFGKLPWALLFQPAIQRARNGFAVTTELFNAINSSRGWMLNNKRFRDVFLDTDGRPLPVGSLVKMPLLAATLETVAQQGVSAFYNGSLTDTIVEEIRSANGIVRRDDLENYRSVFDQHLSTRLTNTRPVKGNLTLYSIKPPASGAVLSYILQILDGYPLPDLDTDTETVLWLHRIVESFKFAYADRMLLGDIEYVHNISELVNNMTQPWFGALTRQRLNSSYTQPPEYYTARLAQVGPESGTAHLAVLAPNGDAVSVTSTINLSFGAQVMGSKTGIIYNDEMDDFSTTNKPNAFGIPPSWANRVEAGKRPLSSMCPAIGVDDLGRVRLVIGASGGSRITASTALVAARVLFMNETIRDAIERPRLHHQLYPNVLGIEPNLPKALQDGLKNKGHNLTSYSRAVVQGILVAENGAIYAHSDSRKFAEADGF